MTINIDTVNPVVNTLNNYANNTWTTSQTATFGFNLTETNADTCVLYHNASGGWVANVTKAGITSNANTNFSSITLADGTYVWNVWCNDSAGQTDWFTNNYTLKVDSTNPTITLNAPANYTWQTSSSITFNYTPTDTNIDSCILYHNASGWAANITNSSLISGSAIINSLSLADGIYIWNVWCNDSSGRSALATANYTLRKDATAPTTTMTALLTYSVETFTAQWNATEDTSGIVNYDVQVNDNGAGWTAWLTSTTATSQTYSGTNGHIYYFRIRATDNAGNIGNYSSNVSTTVSTSAPTITFYLNSYGPYMADPGNVINISFSDTNGLDYGQYKVGANGTWINIFSSNYAGTSYNSLWNVSWSSLSEGTNLIYVKAYDDAGNLAEPAQTISFIKDTTAPIISITRPGAGETTDTSFTLSVVTSEIATCRYKIGSGSYTTINTTGTTVHNQSLTGLSLGSNTITINCTDAAGNLGYASETWTVSGTPPSIAGISPSGLTIDDTPTVYVNTSENAACKFDASDIAYASMTYSMNGAGTTHNYTFSTALTDSDLVGDYVYYVRCNDSEGNLMTTSSFISFVLDTDGNYNYTQWLYPTWDTLWLPDDDMMGIMGYSNFNISVMLGNSRFLHANPYTDVYYYNGSAWSGYSPTTGWQGSDLKYVNNTNDKPYWIKLNSSVVVTKTRFQI